MTIRASGGDSVVLESPRSSVVSIESGIELSQASFQTSPRQHSRNYPALNPRPFHPCIAPHVSSRPIFYARAENSRMSSSRPTENANSDPRQQFPNIISKLSRHPWTESTEFIELWNDIPVKTTGHNRTGHEQMISEDYGTPVSNVIADSNRDSFRISWVLSKHPWTASKEFVELWSDIPNVCDVNQNLSKNREDLVQSQLFNSSSSNSVVSKNMIDNKQCQYTNSQIFKNSCVESGKSKETSGNTPVLVLVVQVLLSLIPISAFFMGAIHFGTCPANEGVTTLVYMTGIAGVFLISLYIAQHFADDVRKDEIRYATKVFLAITAILLTIEMILFYSMSPSFENSENYCDKNFYNYAFYMNIAAAGIVFLSVLQQYAS